MKVPKKVIRIAWPIVSFFIANFGQEIVTYVVEEIRTIIDKKKRKEMEDAFKRAEDAEQAAGTAKNEEDKLKYYEIAKSYRDEADRKKQFLQEFMIDLDESVEKITKAVQEKTKKIDANDVFGIEDPDGDVKFLDVDDKEIKIKQGKKNIKVKKGKKSKL